MPEPSDSAPPVKEFVAPLTHSYRGAVTAADAYRAIRGALRLERGTLRLGNRFVPIDRYREIAFVALGNAAPSLALGAWEALGERLTQGIIAGASPPPGHVPFRSWELPLGLPGGPAGLTTSQAVEELAGELGEKDLLLLLLSPGALAGLARPPAGFSGPEWRRFLSATLEAGAGGAEVALLNRTLATGPTGGRLSEKGRPGEVETLLLDRGDGAALVGGGPTVPVKPEERAIARGVLERLGHLVEVPAGLLHALAPSPTEPPARKRTAGRPVLITGPGEALEGASDSLVDRRWVCRLAAITLTEPPEAAAERLAERAEEILAELGGVPGRSHRRGEGPAGLAVFAGATLGLPEGVDERAAVDRFLKAAHANLRRRHDAVAIFPTSGALTDGGRGAGGFVEAGPTAEPLHPFAMRSGLTDVGLVAVLLARPGP